MGIHTADAIVLRQYPYRETSALVSCLTDRFGKVKGIIKGLRAPSRRYRSAMEPLTLNRVVFYDTRTSSLHLITQCELLAGFPELQQDLGLARLAASCVELAEVVLELDDPQPAVFTLLHRTLQRLAGADAPGPVATRIHFILRLLRLAGFQPQLDECTGCGRQRNQRGFWSPKQGGLLCEQCLHEDPKAEEMTPQWFGTLAACADEEDPTHLDPVVALAIQQRLEEFLRWRLDRPLKTLRSADCGLRIPKSTQSEIQNPKSEISAR